MNTTGMVITVTDELLAELEEAASNATQDEWELLPGTNLSGPEIIANGESIAWVLDSEADAVHMATANPQTITALTAELRRLRAENAELAKDAGRWRYAAKQDSAGEVDICITQVTWNIFSETYRILTAENADSITDRAMATQ